MNHQLYQSKIVDKYKNRLWKQIRLFLIIIIVTGLSGAYNIFNKHEDPRLSIYLFLFVLLVGLFEFYGAANQSRSIPVRITNNADYLTIEYLDKDKTITRELKWHSFTLTIDSNRKPFSRSIFLVFKFNDNKIEFHAGQSYDLTNKTLLELHQKIIAIQKAST
jgi:hypothetical protein